MQLLSSAELVKTLAAHTERAAAELLERDIFPHLAILLVGSNSDSLTYIDKKQARAKELGITISIYHIEEEEPHDQAVLALDHLSTDEEVHGIIVQLPLPESWSKDETDQLLTHIAPEKDVDGLRGNWVETLTPSTDAAATIMSSQVALPPMVAAVVLLLNHHAISLVGKKIVLVGHGRLVGTPLLQFLTAMGLDVVAVDEETEKILGITKQADILISGTGQPDLITYLWIKEGAVVVDCARDVHRDSVDQIAEAVAPATGGVGPVTVQWLLHNTVLAATTQTSL